MLLQETVRTYIDAYVDILAPQRHSCFYVSACKQAAHYLNRMRISTCLSYLNDPLVIVQLFCLLVPLTIERVQMYAILFSQLDINMFIFSQNPNRVNLYMYEGMCMPIYLYLPICIYIYLYMHILSRLHTIQEEDVISTLSYDFHNSFGRLSELPFGFS